MLNPVKYLYLNLTFIYQLQKEFDELSKSVKYRRISVYISEFRMYELIEMQYILKITVV